MTVSRRGGTFADMAAPPQNPLLGISQITKAEDFRKTVERREHSRDDAERLIDIAERLISGLYVHLPLKRVAFAVSPIERLRLLRANLAGGDPGDTLVGLDFVPELLSIFADLHDLHTQYVAPALLRNRVAFLPFVIERYEDPPGTTVYGITKFDEATVGGVEGELFQRARADGDLRRQIVVTAWNGVPIDRFVALRAPRMAGANAEAGLARAVDTLTYRWLGTLPLPDETRVELDIAVGAESGRLVTDWLVGRPAELPFNGECADGHQALQQGQDITGEQHRRLRRVVFNGSDAPFYERRDETVPVYGIDTPVRYIRIWTFATADVDAFVDGFRQLLTEENPPERLIIDVRGNPGGNVLAAERILQLLGANVVIPEELQYISTQATTAFTAGLREEANFGVSLAFSRSIAQGLLAARDFSRPSPMYTDNVYNRIGQVYDGAVAVLVDARTFSAAEVFAAGVQDNGLGSILGTAWRTGGGGAVTAQYGCLRQLVNADARRELGLVELGAQGSFAIALQRLVRIGNHPGDLLEGAGVEVDTDPVPLTRADVFERNRDLITAVTTYLVDHPSAGARLSVEHDAADRRKVRIDATNVARVAVIDDGSRVDAAGRRAAGARVGRPERGPDGLRAAGGLRRATVPSSCRAPSICADGLRPVDGSHVSGPRTALLAPRCPLLSRRTIDDASADRRPRAVRAG